MFKNGDKSMHLWLKQDAETPLLKWKSGEGHNFTLRGKTFGSQGNGKQNQWFNQMCIARNGVVLLNATVLPNHQGSMRVAVSRDMAKYVTSDEARHVSFAKSATQTLDMGKKLMIQDDSLTLTITSAPANKFSTEKERLMNAHLDLRFVGGLPQHARGIFAEMAGVQPMTKETNALIRPVNKRHTINAVAFM